MSSATTTTSVMSVVSACERSVRFVEECILIPEQSRPRKGLLQLNSRPRLASKSFTLPIWSTTASGTNQEKTYGEEDKERGRKLTIALPRYTSRVGSALRFLTVFSALVLGNPSLHQKSRLCLRACALQIGNELLLPVGRLLLHLPTMAEGVFAAHPSLWQLYLFGAAARTAFLPLMPI